MRVLRRATPVLAVISVGLAACLDDRPTGPDETEAVATDPAAVVDRRGVAEGREIFRHEDFGNWRFWTDTARLHELVETVSPALALQLGLKVDAEAVPLETLLAVLASDELLNDPAVTRVLLAANAVVGLRAEVEADRITRIGITCGLCHSSVDDEVAPGIGRRLDGWPNRDLAVGTILSLLPGLDAIAAGLGVPAADLQAAWASWPPGFYDARLNVDARFDAGPVLIPPAYGLAGVGLETYTGEGPISYWNSYVGIVQMRGRGTFIDPRLGLHVQVPPQEDEVRRRLPALRQYQFSLEAPRPPAGEFDPVAAERGRTLFAGAAQCSRCHIGPNLAGQGRLHPPDATGMEPTWAERSTTGAYRATPLRALWHRPPYFHDGSAATLEDVVAHYDAHFGLGLSAAERQDLAQYLRSL